MKAGGAEDERNQLLKQKGRKTGRETCGISFKDVAEGVRGYGYNTQGKDGQ